MKRKPCRTAASSSTTKTALPGISCRLGCRKIEKEDRTERNAPRHSEAAAVRLNNRAADRESNPHAERFGRDERIKQRFRHLGRDPRARVGNRDLDSTSVFVAGLDDDRAALGTRSVDRID